MKLELTEAVWLDGRSSVTLIELAQCSGLTEHEVVELVELGALEPLDQQASEWSFGTRCIVSARAASRLRRDFELDAHGLALVLTLLDRVEELESALERLNARLPRVR